MEIPADAEESMAFSKPGPKYRVTKMVEVRKLHPKSLIPLTEPPLQLPFTAILEGLTLERDMYRFYYLGQPYQCLKKVMKSAIELIEESGGRAEPELVEVADETVIEMPLAVADPAAAMPGFAWQQISTSQGVLLRARVPGGWLVRVQSSVCFYPDTGHKWDGKTLD